MKFAGSMMLILYILGVVNYFWTALITLAYQGQAIRIRLFSTIYCSIALLSFSVKLSKRKP